MTYPDNTDSVAQDQLRSFVDRIERLETEIADLNADKSEVYKDAKGNGFDVKVLRKVIADRRKDASERAEFETIYELYMTALGSLVRAHVETPSEFGNSSLLEHDADGVITEPGEIQESQPARQAAQDGGQKLSVSSPAATAIGSEDNASDVERTPSYPIQPETAAQTVPAMPGSTLAAEHEAVESSASISEAADPDKSGAEQSALAPAPQFVLRPHCLHPEVCAGQGRQHCYACTRAMTVNGSAA